MINLSFNPTVRFFPLKAYTHTLICAWLALESVLESANSSAESVDFNTGFIIVSQQLVVKIFDNHWPLAVGQQKSANYCNHYNLSAKWVRGFTV